MQASASGCTCSVSAAPTRSLLVSAVLLGVLSVTAGSTNAQERPEFRDYLSQAKLSEGELALQQYLEEHPTDDEARLGLGLIQFSQAVEHFARFFHQHGFRTSGMDVFWNLNIFIGESPFENEHPEPVSYQDVRAALEQMLEDLTKSEATLNLISDPALKCRIALDEIRIDINGDGVGREKEKLWRVLNNTRQFSGQLRRLGRENAVVAFDSADVHWLRGYCHLLSATFEFVLAHDFEETFAATAYAYFASPEPSIPFLAARGDAFGSRVADAIAFIHSIDWPVVEPERLRVAHHHLHEVIRLSRKTWELILTEMDDDQEWIPNPDQTGVFADVGITPEMTEGWLEFLDEAEDILEGEKLIPLWFSENAELGLNFKRIFYEPQDFDLIRWGGGIAAIPYLETGMITDPERWQRFQRVFGGQFIGFAFWFN